MWNSRSVSDAGQAGLALSSWTSFTPNRLAPLRCEHALTIAKQLDTTPEEIRAVIERFDGILY